MSLVVLLGAAAPLGVAGLGLIGVREDARLVSARERLAAAGWSLDTEAITPPEVPDAGNFGAIDALKDTSGTAESERPDVKARVAAIAELVHGLSVGERPLSQTRPLQHDWREWRTWLNKQGLAVPVEESDDLKAVLAALHERGGEVVPRIIEEARTRPHAYSTPSQRSRVAKDRETKAQYFDLNSTISAFRLARFLTLQMEVELAAGNQDAAKDLLVTLHRLADLSWHDNGLVNLLIHRAVRVLIFDSLERMIGSGQAGEDLLILAAAYPQQRPEAPCLKRSLQMELAFGIHMTEGILAQRLSWMHDEAGKRADAPGPGQRLLSFVWKHSISESIAFYLDAADHLEKGGWKGFLKAYPGGEKGLSHVGDFSATPLEQLQSWWETPQGETMRYCGLTGAWMEMRGQMLAVACAAARHKLRTGQPPETLAELPPGLLPAIPQDIDGQPLRYRRIGPAFVIWSVGANMKDDSKGEVQVPENAPAIPAAWPDWQWLSLP